MHSELAERIDTLTQQKNQYMRCAQACRRELQLSQTEVQKLQHYVEQLQNKGAEKDKAVAAHQRTEGQELRKLRLQFGWIQVKMTEMSPKWSKWVKDLYSTPLRSSG